MLTILFILSACGAKPPPTFRIAGTSAAPAAEGSVQVSRGPNGNSHLSVTVNHLAAPGRISQGATVYVVWAAPIRDGVPQNIGALRLDRNLKGTLETVTPLQEFRLLIGVETDPTIQQPTTTPVITATITSRQQ